MNGSLLTKIGKQAYVTATVTDKKVTIFLTYGVKFLPIIIKKQCQHQNFTVRVYGILVLEYYIQCVKSLVIL